MKIAPSKIAQFRGIRLPYKLDKIAAVCATIMFALLCSASAQASEWIEMLVQNNGSVYSIDLDSVQKYSKEPKTFKFWSRHDARNDPEKKFIRQSLVVINCERKTYGVTVTYEKDSQGNISGGTDLIDSDIKMHEINPKTIIAIYSDRIC